MEFGSVLLYFSINLSGIRNNYRAIIACVCWRQKLQDAGGTDHLHENDVQRQTHFIERGFMGQEHWSAGELWTKMGQNDIILSIMILLSIFIIHENYLVRKYFGQSISYLYLDYYGLKGQNSNTVMPETLSKA